jgi:outer membrane protein assembly factor BamB
VNVLRQKAAVRLAAGQKFVFTNLFYAKGADAPDDYKVIRRGEDCAVISGKEEAVAGLAPEGLRVGNLAVEAEMFHLRSDGFTLVNARKLDLGGEVMSATQPVSLEFDFAADKAIMTAEKPAFLPHFKRDGQPTRVVKGMYVATGSIRPESWRKQYREAFTKLIALLTQAAPKPSIAPTAKPTGKPMNAAWKFTAQGGVNCLVSADVDNDGKPETILGSADKNIRLLDASGTERWAFATEGAVNAVCAYDLDGDGRMEIVAGSEDANVHALTTDGKLKWKFECPPVDASIPYMHYGSKGAVRNVWAGVLEKGARPVVIVCPEDGYVFCLDGAGEQLWKYRCGEGVFTSLEVADLQGDGNREIIGGSALCSWSSITLIDAAGKGRRFNGLDGWGTCLTALAVGDTDGDGKPEIVAGTSRNKIYFLDCKGATKWTFSLGDAPSCLALADLDGDGRQEIIAGSASFFLYALSRDGKLLWRLNLGDEVTALCAIAPTQEKSTILAGTRSGRIYHVSTDGRVVSAGGGCASGAGSLSARGAVGHVVQGASGQAGGAPRAIFGTAEGDVGLVELTQ